MSLSTHTIYSVPIYSALHAVENTRVTCVPTLDYCYIDRVGTNYPLLGNVLYVSFTFYTIYAIMPV